MSSTATERLKNRSTGDLQRSVVVNSDGQCAASGGLERKQAEGLDKAD
jgi:hypothetical protein